MGLAPFICHMNDVSRLQLACYVIRSKDDPTLTYNTTKRMWVPSTLGTLVMDSDLASLIVEIMHLNAEVVEVCQIPSTQRSKRTIVGRQA